LIIIYAPAAAYAQREITLYVKYFTI